MSLGIHDAFGIRNAAFGARNDASSLRFDTCGDRVACAATVFHACGVRSVAFCVGNDACGDRLLGPGLWPLLRSGIRPLA